jgi:hypothetical protein
VRSNARYAAADGAIIAPAALLAIAYLALNVPTADLAAQAFRADLFGAHGLVLWNNDWYAGHYVLNYGLLFPPLGAALGTQLAGALAAVAAACLFGVLARRRYGERARLGVLWFGAATATMLLAGQLTFALGVALGLGALVAAQRRRAALAGGLAALTSFASPVAGMFVAIAGASLALTGQRRIGITLAAAALVPIAALALAFPSGGYFPFAITAFLAVPLFAVCALFVLPEQERALRVGVVLYLLVCIGLLVVHTPVGANAARLGSLFAGPVLALVLAGRRPVALAIVALPLLYWQWGAPVRDLANALGDSSADQAYYRPLIAELQRRTEGHPVRIEIPPTEDRGEAEYVARRFPLARGWLRQLESDDFDLFKDGELTPVAYRRWLDAQGVSYVAVSDAEPDYLAEDEKALIRAGLPYLRPVWSNEHWQLYAVRGTPGLISQPREPPGQGGRDRLIALRPSSATIAAPHGGPVLVRVHYTRYWTVIAGDACVERRGDWTLVHVRDPGRIEISARFSVGALFGASQECSG